MAAWLVNGNEPPMSFFEDEVRDGFLIPSMMKRLWALNIKSYRALETECEKHGVHCSAIFGSLLGAIRHGGFIPWDDDIDIEMVRDKYLYIEKDARENKLPDDYRIGDYITDYGENMVRRWMTSNSLVEAFEKWKEHYGFPFVCIMDIFLLDYLPTDEKELAHFWDVLERMGELSSSLRGLDNKTAKKRYSNELKKAEWELKYRFDTTSEVPLAVQVMMALDEFCLSYKDKGCDHLGVTHYCKNSPSRIIPENLYEHYVKVRFEYGEISVPAGYDGIMRRNFGNYMTPVLNFGIHGYPVYRRMSEDAGNVAGFELTEFRYDKTLIKKAKEERKSKQANEVFYSLRESKQMLADAHKYISMNIEADPDGVVGLISQCQDLAISMGESIEENMENPHTAVSVLEKYCEYIYTIYQLVYGEIKPDEIGFDELNLRESISGKNKANVQSVIDLMCEGLSEYEKRICEAIESLTKKKRIVFITYKAKLWKGMHSMWQEAVDSGYDVCVIAVPYYYKDFEQKIEKESMVCETKGYPDGVMLTAYDAYDFEKNLPDRIVCQYPYDEYGGVLVLHPFYMMSNLYQYTEELVLVPPFILREIGENDIQPRYTWGTYLKTPGVILADKVYVQSDNMKRVSIEILKGFSGEDTSTDWETKIISDELPVEKWNRTKKLLIHDTNNKYFTKTGEILQPNPIDEILELSDDLLKKIKKDDGTIKKVLLYRLGASMLYEYGLSEVKRADDAIHTMEKQSDDILVIWTEDPYAEDILKNHRTETWESYCRLRDKFVARDNGVLITAESLWSGSTRKNILKLADAFYGDACPEMNEMRVMGKPVMWATPGVEICR